VLKRIAECRPEIGDMLQDLISENEAALQEQVLNCNMYRTIEDAEAAFLNEGCKKPCGNCSIPRNGGSVLVHKCGVKWLFSVAPNVL
jgi:hypothetical protein